MRFGHDELLLAERRIGEAAFDPRAWPGVLDSIRKATDGFGAQFAGLSARQGLLFDGVTGIDPDLVSEFERLGGPDPAINPRARIWNAPAAHVVDDDDLMTEAEREKNAFFNEFLLPHDAAHMPLTLLHGPGDIKVFFGGIRSAKQGPAEQHHHDAMRALIPHLQAAINLQVRLDLDATRLMVGTLEAVQSPAFLFDGWSNVVAVTQAAETLVRFGDLIQLKRGRLSAKAADQDRNLQAAMRRAALGPFGGQPRASSLILHDLSGAPRRVEVAPMALGPLALRSHAVGVVAIPGPPPTANAEALLQQAWGLTAAEAQVAVALADGQRAADIAEARAVSIETVRNQLKHAMGKTGAANQVSLALQVLKLVGERR